MQVWLLLFSTEITELHATDIVVTALNCHKSPRAYPQIQTYGTLLILGESLSLRLSYFCFVPNC